MYIRHSSLVTLRFHVTSVIRMFWMNSHLASLLHRDENCDSLEHNLEEDLPTFSNKIGLRECFLPISVPLQRILLSLGQTGSDPFVGVSDNSLSSEDNILQSEPRLCLTWDTENSDNHVPSVSMLAVLSPLWNRFMYHFATERTTSRLDRPEWPLSYLLAAFDELSVLCSAVLQPSHVNKDNLLTDSKVAAFGLHISNFQVSSPINSTNIAQQAYQSLIELDFFV